MSETKKTPAQWKSEQLRAERKARLARMKSKEGGKKRIKTTNPMARLIIVIILVIALSLTAVWAVIRSGLPHRQLTAVTIGNVDIKAVDVNYYYFQQLSTYGLDPADPEGQATLRAPSGIDGFRTNADYLKDQAVQQLQQDALLAEQARQAGLSLSTEEQERIDTYLASIATAAAREGMTPDNYLIKAFGTGMNEAVLRRCVERMLLSDLYAEDKRVSFTFDETALLAAYHENPNSYDLVDYRVFYHAASIPSGATAAERTKALEEARQRAGEMLDRITDEASFRELSIEYAAENDVDDYRDNDVSLKRNQYFSKVTPVFIRNWLYETERSPGDKSVVDSTSGYYVVMFLNRARADYEHVNVRHILISAMRTTATDEQIATARQQAESILAEYLAGDRTENAFAALAKEHTADGNAEQGGLYEGVYLGQMVPEFDNWCFDQARRTGDTGIVQTDYGFHVMYYVGENGVDWKLRVEQTLQDQAYQAYLGDLVEQNTYSVRSLGYRFVG